MDKVKGQEGEKVKVKGQGQEGTVSSCASLTGGTRSVASDKAGGRKTEKSFLRLRLHTSTCAALALALAAFAANAGGLRHGLALRGAATGGGEKYNGYVERGLVAYWDGIDNAGTGTHDPNATRWADLAGGNDWTAFAGGAGFVGGNRFTTGAAQNTATFERYDTARIRTVEVVAKASGISGIVVVGFSRMDYDAVSGRFNTTRWFGLRANSTFNFGQGATAASVATPYAVHHYAGTTADVTSNANIPFAMYLDGRPVSGAGAGLSWAASDASGKVNGQASAYSATEIYAVRLYDRELSAEEVAKNYAVDARRFGL